MLIRRFQGCSLQRQLPLRPCHRRTPPFQKAVSDPGRGAEHRHAGILQILRPVVRLGE